MKLLVKVEQSYIKCIWNIFFKIFVIIHIMIGLDFIAYKFKNSKLIMCKFKGIKL